MRIAAHRSPGSARHRAATSATRLPIISALRAFSLTSRITQRDGTTGRDAPGSRPLLYPGDPGPYRPAPPRSSRASGRLPGPGLLDDPGRAPAPRPGSPGVRRHPAGSPAITKPGPRAACCICGLDCRSEWCTGRRAMAARRPAGRRAGGRGMS